MDQSPLAPPDDAVRRTALGAADPGLGRLAEVAAWWSSCRGDDRTAAAADGDAQTAPTAGPPRRARLVLFAAEPVTDSRAGARVEALAEVAGVGVRRVDGRSETARPIGPTDESEAEAAVRRGRAVADEEVDAGADLLLAAELCDDTAIAASALVAAMTGREPTAVVGVPPGPGGSLDDATWMHRVPAVRDLLRHARPAGRDPLALLAHADAPDLAAVTGFLAQAAVRRTPVVLDGLVSTAAALLAASLEPGARDWWLAGTRCPEPAAGHALDVLGLDPLVDLGVWPGHGCGALVAVTVIRAALAAAPPPS